MEKGWVAKDLVAKEVWERVYEKFSGLVLRSLRLFVLIGIVNYFFAINIVPTESMNPTIQVNDMLLFKKTQFAEKGDIIFFDFPLDEEQMYLKRVIATEGDVIEIKDGLVYVNEKVVTEDYIAEPPDYIQEPFTVPKDSYYVLGDNRNESHDSYDWGVVPKDLVKGKVLSVILPFNRIHLLFLSSFLSIYRV